MIDEVRLIGWFPRLAPPSSFRITSDKTTRYNCIAYAAGDERRCWWPDSTTQAYWPPNVPREPTLAAFIAAFQFLGFSVCDSGDFEQGVEKVAFFAKPAGTPTHAARQFPNGEWRSKLGSDHDIEHRLRAIEGSKYGAVALFMKRPSPS